MTRDLLGLLDWLTTEGCTHAAIESTAVSGSRFSAFSNPASKSSSSTVATSKESPVARPASKTVSGSPIVFASVCFGPSFIPPRHIRELRELTRYRYSLIKQLGALVNRIQKLAESANKQRLTSVRQRGHKRNVIW